MDKENKLNIKLTRTELKHILFAISCINKSPDKDANKEINKIYKRLNKINLKEGF